ncbi:MAG: macro domain-containing protein [Candidatus Heimdallarchaeaceae archaeon]
MSFKFQNIQIKKGDIFKSKMQTIVNPINCQGVMGAGLAKKFKEEFPSMFEDYKKKCENKLVQIGKPYLWKEKENSSKWILNFPTKNRWSEPSKFEWIRKGLKFFVENYAKWDIKSIAFPALGCGHGGLLWLDIKPLLEEYLSKVDIPVEIYLPKLSKSEKAIEKIKTELENRYKENVSVLLIRDFYPNSVDTWVNLKKATSITLFIRFNRNNVTNEMKMRVKEIIDKTQKKYGLEITYFLNNLEKTAKYKNKQLTIDESLRK